MRLPVASYRCGWWQSENRVGRVWPLRIDWSVHAHTSAGCSVTASLTDPVRATMVVGSNPVCEAIATSQRTQDAPRATCALLGRNIRAFHGTQSARSEPT